MGKHNLLSAVNVGFVLKNCLDLLQKWDVGVDLFSIHLYQVLSGLEIWTHHFWLRTARLESRDSRSGVIVKGRSRNFYQNITLSFTISSISTYERSVYLSVLFMFLRNYLKMYQTGSMTNATFIFRPVEYMEGLYRLGIYFRGLQW